MLKVYKDVSLDDFQGWFGGEENLNILKEEEVTGIVESILEECFPYGLSETELNDFLWFETDTINEWIGRKIF